MSQVLAFAFAITIAVCERALRLCSQHTSALAFMELLVQTVKIGVEPKLNVVFAFTSILMLGQMLTLNTCIENNSTHFKPRHKLLRIVHI